MNDRRSQISIFRDILYLIYSKQGKAKPTHILYGANLSHTRLKKYLNSLIEKEFIQKIEVEGRQYYMITEKGREFLREFKKIKDISEAFGIPI